VNLPATLSAGGSEATNLPYPATDIHKVYVPVESIWPAPCWRS